MRRPGTSSASLKPMFVKVHFLLETAFPQTVWLTLGFLAVVVKGRGVRSEVASGNRGNFRTFVLACSFFVVTLVLSGWPRWSGAGFSW